MWSYLLFFLAGCISSEVITLINEEEIICVLTGESRYSGLYIWPPIKNNESEYFNVKREIKEINNWAKNDWDRRYEDVQIIPPTDIRWESYRITSREVFFKGSIYFSKCSTSSDETYLDTTSQCNWIHYSIDKTQLIKVGSTRQPEVTHQIPYHNYITTENNFPIKYQPYNFLFSYTNTGVNYSNYINLSNITTSNKLCLSMFISINVGCRLNIVLKTNNSIVNKTINGFYPTILPRKWKRFEIESNNYNGTGKLSFFSSDGTWGCFIAIDYIHLCRPDIDIYRTNLQQKTLLICRTLEMNNKKDMEFCEEPNKLGKNCTTNCEEILGASCDSYTVCLENGNCRSRSSNEYKYTSETTLENESSRKYWSTTEGTTYFSENCSLNKSSLSTPNIFILTVSLLAIVIVFSAGLLFYIYRYQKIPFLPVFVKKPLNISHVDNLKNSILKNHMLVKEFTSVTTAKTKLCEAAFHPKNLNRNKDQIHIPYDSTRVVLKVLPGVGTDDYINASFLNSYDRAKAYIACQGPKFYTVSDFWRMVWQERVETIVMASEFIENGQRKCAEYYNMELDRMAEYGHLVVKLIKEDIFEHYTVRTLEVCYSQNRREISHVHLKWNEQKLLYPNDIVPVVLLLRQLSRKSASPIVLHSSLGVNRNGLLILCDLALQMIEVKNKLDFSELLEYMRDQRPNMVNKQEFYNLAHLVVLECLLEKDKPFKTKFTISEELIPNQIEFLEKVTLHDTLMGFWAPKTEVPKYNFVEGYGGSKKFLLIDQPTPKLLRDFWTLVAEEQIQNLVFLNFTNDKPWPFDSRNFESAIQVTQSEQSQFESHVLTKLDLTLFDGLTHQLKYKSQISLFELNTFQLCNAPVSKHLLCVIRDLRKIKQFPVPILVASSDGLVAASLFVTLFYLIDKYDQELEFDVYTALRIVNRCSSRFVNRPEHLKFIYAAMLEYFQNFDEYMHVHYC